MGARGMGRAGEFVAGALLSLLALLPLPVVRALGRALGELAWWRGGRSARITRSNIAACLPALAATERMALARASLRETGAAIAELGLAWRGSRARLARTIRAVHGQELLDEAGHAGRGLLLLAPHLGNWELLLHCVQGQRQCTVLYRTPRQPALAALALRGRTRFGLCAVAVSHAGVRELLQVLRRGETVVLLPDQVPARSGGQSVPFFGQPAWTPVLAHALARRTGCAVLAGCCLRVRGGFELHFATLDRAFHAPDRGPALAAMNRAIEHLVREAPAQYQWEYRRLRAPPKG